MNFVFKNRFHHLRAGWRMMIWTGIVLLCFGPVAGLMKLWDVVASPKNNVSGVEQFNSPVSIIFYLGLNVAIVIGSWLTLRWVDRRPYALLGLDFKWSALRDYGLGFLLGMANVWAVLLFLWTASSVLPSLTVVNTGHQ